MGISIDLHIYDYRDLADRLQKAGFDDLGRVDAILDECGSRIDHKYVLLNNEHYDDYNPYYSLFTLLDAAFGFENRAYDAFAGCPGRREGKSSVDQSSVAEKLGITIPEEAD